MSLLTSFKTSVGRNLSRYVRLALGRGRTCFAAKHLAPHGGENSLVNELTDQQLSTDFKDQRLSTDFKNYKLFIGYNFRQIITNKFEHWTFLWRNWSSLQIPVLLSPLHSLFKRLNSMPLGLFYSTSTITFHRATAHHHGRMPSSTSRRLLAPPACITPLPSRCLN